MQLGSFPYIQAIQINDCYAIKNTHIQIFENNEEFRHLILTGKNGSGKTSVLKQIYNQILLLSLQEQKERVEVLLAEVDILKDKSEWGYERIKSISERVLLNVDEQLSGLFRGRDLYCFAFFRDQRKLELKNVEALMSEQEIIDTTQKKSIKDKYINNEAETRLSHYFKHHLVNSKINQAFELLEKKTETISADTLIDSVERILKILLEDDGLQLLFLRDTYNFIIKLSDAREIEFDKLSSGYSAIFDIISELLFQTDLIKKKAGNLLFEPFGIVLIDEPENHAHLSMQEQILPLLTKLFPKVQFIVATHSPAVIASIPNATVFDLSSKQTFRDGLVGSSYSQLMIKLFGLNNQYSTLADQLLNKVNTLLLEENKEKAKTELQKILTENVELLSPSLYLEIESAIHLIQD